MIAPLSINSSHADCKPERLFFLGGGSCQLLANSSTTMLARADEVIE
jgi:hypothetical protein